MATFSDVTELRGLKDNLNIKCVEPDCCIIEYKNVCVRYSQAILETRNENEIIIGDAYIFSNKIH